VSDATPDDPQDEVELDALEADVALIEVAMEKVDSGDLDGYEEVTADLADDPSEQVGDRALGDEFDAGPEAQPAV
jgi:hypothetical protein